METLLGPLLLLLIVALGLATIVGGPSGARRLLGSLLAPFGCLLKAGLGLIALVLVGSALLGPMRNALDEAAGSSSGASTPKPARRDMLLEQYLPLSQHDFSIYESRDFANTLDDVADSQGGKLLPVHKLACLSTVYLMLYRGHYDAAARIGPRLYQVNGAGALEPEGFRFTRKDYFDGSEIVAELREGRPAIIFATLAKAPWTHFVLAVGFTEDRKQLIINDPETGERSRIDLNLPNPPLRGQHGSRCEKMRLVQINTR